MATFKVGQRVRYIGTYPLSHVPTGAEGTVTGLGYEDGKVSVLYDNWPSGHQDGWLIWPSMLAPLTDPKADEFIEQIKKLKPYEEPTVPKVKT